MLQSFNAVDGQSILDVCLNTYGNLDKLTKLMQDSGHPSIDVAPVRGQLFVFDNTQIDNQVIGSGIENQLYVIRDLYATDEEFVQLPQFLLSETDQILFAEDNQALKAE